MADSLEIKKFNNDRDNATAVSEFLNEVFHNLGLQDDPFLDALCSDVLGLLAGIGMGTITAGQPRIVERLIQIVQNRSPGMDTAPIATAIAVCGERGLSALDHVFSRHTRSATAGDR
mgnify:CR=1 FL=1